MNDWLGTLLSRVASVSPGFPTTREQATISAETDKGTTTFAGMTLADIADEIARDWPSAPPEAKAYITALQAFNTIDDIGAMGDARTIVSELLFNSYGWKGDKADAIKSELSKRLGQYPNMLPEGSR